jgi:hypothetical protein
MLALLFRFSVSLGETSVCAEHKVTEGYLIEAILRVYHLAMVQDIESKETLLVVEVLAVLPQTDVEGSRGVVWADEDLLLEDDAVLRGNILI